ncbi:MAG: CBS domain-containing protein [endosymbiont of Galathealinum brachiosum]|uniref:CBS domain-containing protein n=1 Tax=endosymbiont of Galathealinum brachiosum TaxID=2200906 RepID=A0A370DIS1_9GAMM|nr:MAG: CBS domain-containing protein [endosymbiont of Galathealinum brachiosum]
MSIKDIMSTSIVTVRLGDSVAVVKEIFDNSPFHHLLVVDSGELFGIISDRDLFKILSPTIGTVSETTRDLAILNKKAHQILTRKPITLSEKSGLSDVIKVFKKHNISCIPVVNDENEPVGIVSWRDLLKIFDDK